MGRLTGKTVKVGKDLNTYKIDKDIGRFGYAEIKILALNGVRVTLRAVPKTVKSLMTGVNR